MLEQESLLVPFSLLMAPPLEHHVPRIMIAKKRAYLDAVRLRVQRTEYATMSVTAKADCAAWKTRALTNWVCPNTEMHDWMTPANQRLQRIKTLHVPPIETQVVRRPGMQEESLFAQVAAEL